MNMFAFKKPERTDESFKFIEKSIKRLTDFKDETCTKCVHRHYGDECRDCFFLESDKASLVNFFPCMNFTRDEILNKMTVKEIENYLLIRHSLTDIERDTNVRAN
jgi:hypothetical protein